MDSLIRPKQASAAPGVGQTGQRPWLGGVRVRPHLRSTQEKSPLTGRLSTLYVGVATQEPAGISLRSCRGSSENPAFAGPIALTLMYFARVVGDEEQMMRQAYEEHVRQAGRLLLKLRA